MTEEEVKADVLKRAIDLLSEYFDCVQILTSWHEEGLTKSKKAACGNWFARKAMCEDFIDINRDEELAAEIARKMEPPEPDDSEAWKKA